MDVAAFLGGLPPFDALETEALRRVSARVQIEHFAPGATILAEAGEPARFLYVVRKGAVEAIDAGRLIDLLGPGEVFGAPSLLGHAAPTLTMRAHEDTLCYLIDEDAAAEVLGSGTGVRFLLRSLRRQIVAMEGGRPTRAEPGAYRPVGSLVRRAPVFCEPGTPVAEAAERMTRERVSCLLVPTREGLGILTDRDLRSRVVAERRDPATPVADVMTFPAIAIHDDVLSGDVLLAMLEGGFHHFPVRDRTGALLGVVTDTDLMGLGRHTPFALKSAIERAGDADAVVAAAAELPLVVATLVEGGADAVDVGRVIALSVDTLTQRLLRLGMDRLGEPPAPWAWLALGSAARQEQALATDQDHAFVFDPPGAAETEIDAYLAELAASVTGGLEAAGIPRCRGDAMASHPQMRRSLEGWRAAFRSWIDEPGSHGSILVSVAFDYRRVDGPLDVEPALDELLRTVPEHPLFIRQLAKRALDHRPPTGFVRDLVVEAAGDHAGRLDVKQGGIAIVSNLARAEALRLGLAGPGTIERLRSVAALGAMDAETAAGLEDAFRFLWGARLEHQVRRWRSGTVPDDFLDPAELGTIARRGLKESFRVIARAQRTVAAELGGSAR